MNEALSFDFRTSGSVIFGWGQVERLCSSVGSWGPRALLVTGTHPERHGALVADLPMEPTGFTVGGEPTVDMVRAAMDVARQSRVTAVIAIGGGSVLDLGKAVAVLLTNGGDPLDYLEVVGGGRPITAPSVPFAAVPTTAGTGAEVTANAVISSPEHGRKASLRSPFMVPRLALVDPELRANCPPAVTAASGLDALTQCLEPFVSPQATPLTDALAAEGIKRAATGLRAAYTDGSNGRARTEMALCSLLGGMSLTNAKLGAVHGFAGVIGGLIGAPHGAVCAALLAPVTETNVAALRARNPHGPALARYRQAAALLTGRPEASIEDGIAWLRDTVIALDVPGLGAFGVRPDAADDIVAKTRSASSTRGNPILLTDDELHRAFTLSLD